MQQDIRARLKKINIITRRLMRTSLIGDYLSAFKGSGMEFDQLREYVPGDDVRSIDWYGSLKADKTMVKQFVEERDRTVIVMLDLSASTFFSSQSQLKRDLMVEVASALAFVASNTKDRVGALLYSDRVEKWIAPSRGRMHVSTILDAMLCAPATHRGSDIGQALRFLAGLKMRQAVVFILSDFIDDLERVTALLKLANCKHDCIALRFLDPREQQMPAIGLLEVEDIESGNIVTLDARGQRKQGDANINTMLTARMLQQKRLCEAQKIDLLDLQVGKPYLHSLVQFFHQRIRRSI